MFDTIYSNPLTAASFFIMLAIALASGLLYSFLLSFKARSSKSFFVVLSLLPAIAGTAITFMSENLGLGAGVAIGGFFLAVRFRSAQGNATEMIAIFAAMASGIIFGQGYVAYGAIALVGFALFFFAFSYLPIFTHKNFTNEKLLKITIPESLDYSEVFDETFAHYLSEVELVGVKTTDMGSLFKLSYRVKMKQPKEEKELLDELRIRNGNLEISLLPYVPNNVSL